MPKASVRPFAMRWSLSAVPEAMFVYSRRSSASSVPRVPRLTASISSLPTFSSHDENSCRPTSFVSVECQARSRRRGRLVARSDAVLPAEAGDEVAAGVADGRDAELLDELDDVAAEALGVGRRVPGLVEPVVDAPAEVLDERAEESRVDGADGEVGVDGEACGDHVSSFEIRCGAAY